jgi:hypothetical protein
MISAARSQKIASMEVASGRGFDGALHHPARVDRLLTFAIIREDVPT